MKKKKKIIVRVIIFLVAAAIGFCGGIALAMAEKKLNISWGVPQLFGAFLALVFGMWFQVIIHEGGHLICGLLSGYQFVSFRIGSRMLVKNEKGFRLKRFSLAGTGGQCLMDPPKLKDGNVHYVLYNLGGVLMNLLSAAACAVICLCAKNHPWIAVYSAIVAVVGVYLGAVNGIPLRVGGVDNDGKNILTLKKDKNARKYFWLQLHINGELVRGKRMKDMPVEWFEKPEKMDDALSATVACLKISRLMDEMKLEEAKKEGEELLEKAVGLLDVQKKMIQGEMLFLELLGEQNAEKLEELEKKEFQKFLKITKNYPSTARLLYADALLRKKDEKEAEKWRKHFDRAIQSYPNEGEVAGEQALMECVRKKYEEK